MRKLILLLAVAGVAVAGCRSDDYDHRNNTNYNNGNRMNGTYPNQSVNPTPGSTPNSGMNRNAPANQSGAGMPPL